MPIDSTFLDIEKSDEIYSFGRDYIAHAVRWSMAMRALERLVKELGRPAVVFDIGCGRKMPLAQTIFTGRHFNLLHQMICFDAKVEKTRNFTVAGVNKVFIVEGDFCESYRQVAGILPDICTCFEAFEHMPFQQAWQFVRTIRAVCGPATKLLFSTPNYSPTRGAAKNHQNECRIELVTAILENSKFKVIKATGMYCEIKKAEERCMGLANMPQLFKELRDRFDNEVLSMIFAGPMPAQSKAVLYECVACEEQGATDDEVIAMANDPMFRQA